MNVIIPSSLFVRNMLFDPFHGYTGHFQTFDPSDKINQFYILYNFITLTLCL